MISLKTPQNTPRTTKELLPTHYTRNYLRHSLSASLADGDARPDAGLEVELQQVLVTHAVVPAVEVDAVVPQHRLLCGYSCVLDAAGSQA